MMTADRSLMLVLPLLMSVSSTSMAEGEAQRIRPLPDEEWSPKVRGTNPR